MTNFFISHSQQDTKWAEWIAWTLEEAGYSVILPSRDFTVGKPLILEFEKALSTCEHTIAVLSHTYLTSSYTQPEWAAAFSQDPTGKKQTLIPVRVDDVRPTGLLASLLYIDLVGKEESEAAKALLQAIAIGRKKASNPPKFPTSTHRSVETPPLSYPGAVLNDPPELIPFCQLFRSEYPDPRKSAFIIMRFGSTPRHNNILQAIKKTLNRHEIIALRADDKVYADDLMPNIRTYMHGCGFGIAVFERIESDQHNPNVALEVGYMLALGKRICLLKDKSLARLPTDIIGSMYYEFDTDNIESTIQESIDRWLTQRGIIKKAS